MLEPRRLATRAAARRMAQLTGGAVGGLVGYQTRDERRVGPATRVEVLTEGVLTAPAPARSRNCPAWRPSCSTRCTSGTSPPTSASPWRSTWPRRCVPICACWRCRPPPTPPSSPGCSPSMTHRHRCWRASGGCTRWRCAGGRANAPIASSAPPPAPSRSRVARRARRRARVPARHRRDHPYRRPPHRVRPGRGRRAPARRRAARRGAGSRPGPVATGASPRRARHRHRRDVAHRRRRARRGRRRSGPRPAPRHRDRHDPTRHGDHQPRLGRAAGRARRAHRARRVLPAVVAHRARHPPGAPHARRSSTSTSADSPSSWRHGERHPARCASPTRPRPARGAPRSTC